MAMTSGEVWERYDRWNEAIAAVVFPPAAAGQPVYLDLEDDVIGAIRDLAEPTNADPGAALVHTVCGTLRFDQGPSDVFRRHLGRLGQWERGDLLEPPPTLGLLAMLSLAAENMHEGEGLAAHNFYGRVADLLGLDQDQLDCFINGYRKHLANGQPVSEKLWESLTLWLELLEGNRGLPTAYAETHAHVGLALSQALVRRTDRERLHDLFALYGLAPQSSLPAAELAELIGEWLSRVPCPASNSFNRMWQRDATTRERIAEIACLTLESWDGSDTKLTGSGSSERLVDSVRATAMVRRFPSMQLELGCALPSRSGAIAESLSVLGPDDRVIGTLDFVPSSSGWMAIADPTAMDMGTFLRGEIRLRKVDPPLVLRRRSRRLVPLRRDEMLQAFVECERVSLGDDFLLVARSEIAAHVTDILRQAARPGFRVHEQLLGLPAGWTLFEGVQILSSIPDELLRNRLVDLNVLQPIASTQSVLEGGLQIPGNIRKWSSSRAPELRVTADNATTITAVLRCVRPLAVPAPEERRHRSDQPVMIWDLQTEHLPDGDYEIALAAGKESLGRPLMLRLRSADNPAVVIPSDDPVALHSPASPMYGLCVARLEDPEGFICAPLEAAPVETDPFTITQTPEWWDARTSAGSPAARSAPLAVPAPDDRSCMVTGGHYMVLETALSGMSSVEGVCRSCGLVKRYPTRGRNKRSSTKRSSKRPPAPRIDVSSLEPVPERLGVDWEIGFDALCHIGEGPISALTRVASQMESSDLFGDAFTRRLEALGHIEVERDRSSLAAAAWKVIDPTFVGLPDGEAVLVGFRNEHLIAHLEDVAYLHGVELVIDRSPGAPPRISLKTRDGETLSTILGEVGDATGRNVQYIPRASESISARLPSLSAVLASLPTTSAISGRSFERWNPITARFESASDMGVPGAYRVSGFGRAYMYRRQEHIGTMTALVGNARVVKYAAALDARRTLVGYDVGARVLYVPLGADLPGLYGRAAVLASGRPPRENLADHLLEYRRVPPEVAAHLNHLLMS